MITRRALLKGGAAGCLAIAVPSLVRAGAPGRLVAGKALMQIAPAGYPETEVWSYALDAATGEGSGPVIRARQGDRLRVTLENALEAPTTVHWHGIRIENAMDGVPDVTQAPVAPGDEFTYDFALPDAGTYWYHSHFDSVQQVARGLHGPLVIDEETPPDVDEDIVLVLDDWRLDSEAQIFADFDNRHDMSHGGRFGNVVSTNGRLDWRRDVKSGARVRLRLINVANARIFDLGAVGLTGWVVALDGMPLARPRPLGERFALGPAQRMDIIADIGGVPGDEIGLVEHIRDEAFAQATFRVTDGGPARSAPPEPLPPNADFGEPDASSARRIEIRMEGGAMRGIAEAMSGRVVKDGRTLAMEGLFWALSGQAGRPEAPLAEVARGETVALSFVNDTAFPHAMHLHGHHFRELTPDGAPGDFRDTTLVMPGETRNTLFVAHNPGDWLLHCHMLGHHASGMGTWLRVG